MFRYSKVFKLLGLTLLGVTGVLFALEAFVPSMYGVHWFGIYTFMPGLGLYFISVLLDKKPMTKPDAGEASKTKKPLSLISRIIWSTVFLLFFLTTLYNLVWVLISYFK